MLRIPKNRAALSLALLAVTLLSSFHSAGAGEEPDEGSDVYRVGAFISPPFMMKRQDGAYFGMAMDIWVLATKDLGLKTEFVEYHDFTEMLDDLADDKIDFIVTNLVVSYARTDSVLFGYPWHDGGLRILTRSAQDWSLVHELRKNGLLKVYALFIFLLIVLSFVITMIRRRLDGDFTKSWREGWLSNLYGLVVAAKTGRMDYLVKNWIGYLASVTWVLFGLGIMAYITSTMAGTITAAQLERSDIENVHDLHDKQVAVIGKSVAQIVMKDMGIAAVPYPNLAEAIEALRADEVDAVVGDGPSLEYYLARNLGKELVITGPVFHPLHNAFGCQKRHDDLMDLISQNIIKLYSHGDIERVRRSYFGLRR